ncbi:MAG: hypothetical protein WBD32_22545 [Acidobacteriaceae bacterium]
MNPNGENEGENAAFILIEQNETDIAPSESEAGVQRDKPTLALSSLLSLVFGDCYDRGHFWQVLIRFDTGRASGN